MFHSLLKGYNMSKISVLSKDSRDVSPNGWLATLLRRLLRESVGMENIPSLYARCVNRMKDSKDELSASRNTIAEMYKDKITFNSFLGIVKALFRPKRLKITISITAYDGCEYDASITPIYEKEKEDGK